MRAFNTVLPTLLALVSFAGQAAGLVSVPVRVQNGGGLYAAEGVVEAVRQSVMSPQVAGLITQIAVKAGDRVKKGQLLVRIDSRAAAQQASASAAQVEAARAQLEVAKKEFERQQQLFKKQYISEAALEQAQAQYKATEAAVRGTLAQAGAANTQTGFFTLSAPYGGVVAEVGAEQGDMAMPGKPLLTVYDPTALRVTAPLPQSRVGALPAKAQVQVDIPGLAAEQRRQTVQSIQVLPTADPVSHTVQVRLGLGPAAAQAVPGMFARAYFPLTGESRQHLLIPASAVLQRSELMAVYVLDVHGRALLRQVRLGELQGEEVEVLSGLSAGERVATDPAAAARQR